MIRVPHMNTFWGIRFLPAVLVCMLLCTPSCGETKVNPAVISGVKRADVEEGLRRIVANKTLPEAERTKAAALYQDALKDLAAAENWKQKSDQYEAMRQTAAVELEAVRQELASPSDDVAPINVEAETLSHLKERYLVAAAEDAKYKEELAGLEKEIARRAARQREVPLQLEAARKRMTQLEAPVPVSSARETPEVTDARRTITQARFQVVSEEIQALGKELPAYEAQSDFLLAKKELQASRSKVAARRVEALSRAIDQKQKLQAVALVAEASQVVQNVNPALAALAQGNESLAKRLAGEDGVSARLRRLTETVKTVEADLAEVRQRAKTLDKQEKIIGLTEAMSVLLRRYHADLPSPAQVRREIAAVHPPVDKVQLNVLELEDQRDEIGDIPVQAREMARQLGAKLSSAKQEELAQQATKLLETRRKLLKDLLDDTNEYFQKRLVLEELLTTLRTETKTLRDYIEESILWTRSASLLGWSSGPNIREEFGELTSPEHWREVVRVLHWDGEKNPVGYGFLAVVILALLAARGGLHRGIDNSKRRDMTGAGKGGTFRQTLLALLLTLLLSAPLPLLLWVLSWRLGVVPTEVTFPAAVAAALYAAGVILAILCVLLNVCRRRGLAEVHFHWSPDANTVLRRYLRILTAFILPLVFLVVLANQQSQIVEISSLGRLLLILALAVVAIFNGLLFRPNGPLGKQWYRAREGMLFRLRHIWYAVTVLMPVALMVLAWVGYYSLALRLTWEMTISSWFIVALLLFNGLMLRWLTVLFYTVTTRRQRRTSTTEDAGLDVDVTSLREQSRRVLRFAMGVILVLGLWGIWADSLPTLRRVGRVPLWETSKTVTVETVDKEGRRVTETEERMEPVTVGDGIVAVLVLILTFVAARSASGLLRVLILRRSAMDNGAKYAITVLVRYTIGVVGVVISVSLLGLRWGSIQWLVAAMTVGLGFGLQEIFANLVSGLIILFERPIRIGDTVTVGDSVGTVTKLRIRATTITDWDRKELIVPNREFVTNRLVNWTLSDKILRVVLRVGIAYGSDTELAERILHEVAEKQSLILKTPDPIVLFTGFGDNALNFELRVYIRGIESYLKVWHETNMAIDKTFREHNITIAFPQRDTHLNTSSPLDIRILPPTNRPKSESGQ